MGSVGEGGKFEGDARRPEVSPLPWTAPQSRGYRGKIARECALAKPGYLRRKGSHMSTHTARTARRRRGGSAAAKNWSRVSRLRSRPIQMGSPDSRSLTTVRNPGAFRPPT